jgi:hypothetical protein
MLNLPPDLEEPYIPFVSSRHSTQRIHEVRRREPRVGQSRRILGRALVRAGLVIAGLAAAPRR